MSDKLPTKAQAGYLKAMVGGQGYPDVDHYGPCRIGKANGWITARDGSFSRWVYITEAGRAALARYESKHPPVASPAPRTEGSDA